jgi:hypothetical protein
MANPVNAGLSLIEVMVCAALLVVALEASFNAMGTAYHSQLRTEDRSLALSEAQSQIERLQALDESAIATTFAGGIQGFARVEQGSPDSASGQLRALRPQTDDTSADRPFLGYVIPVSRVNGRYCFLVWMGWKAHGGDEQIELYYYWVKRS